MLETGCVIEPYCWLTAGPIEISGNTETLYGFVLFVKVHARAAEELARELQQQA